MARSTRNLLRAAIATALVLGASGTPRAASPRFAGPGPATISPEEAAIQADPAKGLREAVVLLHETELRDYAGKTSADQGRDTRIHRRIKVLSAGFPSNLRVPYDRDIEGISEWWARAIRPDGTVLELSRSSMKVVHDELVGTALEGRFAELPTGTVLDYGFTLRQRGLLRAGYGMLVTLDWPTLAYRLRWLPARSGRATILRSGLAPFPVKVATVGVDLEATGLDLPATEPLAPPGTETYLWLLYGGRTPADHWGEVARLEDSRNSLFLNRGGEIARAIEELHLPPGATLDQKLRAAYAFIEDRIKLANFEEKQPVMNEPGWSSGGVLRGHRAWAGDVPRLMVGFARQMGAEATTVSAWNERWDPETPIYLSPDARLVAVRPAGDPAAPWTALAPGWGLAYGVVPHSYAGNRGLLAAREGLASIELPVVTGSSTSSIRGTVTPSVDGKTARVEWTWSGTGQEALFTRRWFQNTKDDLRAAAMARKCVELAASKDVIRFQDLLEASVTEGTVRGLFDRTKPLELHCTTTIPLKPQAAADAGGPLLVPAVPNRNLDVDLELEPPVRRSLYQLPYPVEHTSVIEVRAPEGFAPGEPPEEVRVEAPCCGSYVRTVTKTETGFRVERTLTLPKDRVAASQASAFREFLRKVEEGDRARVEFVGLP